jgi:hypothetical protein
VAQFAGYAPGFRRAEAQAHRMAVGAHYNSTRVDQWAVSYMVACVAAIHNMIDWVDQWAVSYMVACVAAIHNMIDWVATSTAVQVYWLSRKQNVGDQ